MLVLSSPSGAGKTTISRLLLESDTSLTLSVSVTTRPKRPDEVDRRDYSFLPSTAELHARLRRRAQDPEEVVAQRMKRAPDEIAHWSEFDYVVVNRDIQESVSSVRSILTAERLRRQRQIGLADLVKRLSEGL